MFFFFFFFNDTATTEIYTLSLHDALPISDKADGITGQIIGVRNNEIFLFSQNRPIRVRSEEHTSELQSQSNLVCRLLLEKKKKYRPSRTKTIRRDSCFTTPAITELKRNQQ